MNDTRKQIIELISEYMDKTLSEGCLILNDVWVEEMVLFDSWMHPIKWYWYIKTTGSELKYDEEKSEYTKILWHYDITAVLKYIWTKDINISTETDNNCFYIEMLVWQLEKPYFSIKPLHLYTEQEEQDLLELLIKLN